MAKLSTSRCAGFTLLEVILSISILAGMMFGVLSLYQKAASLRNELEDYVSSVSDARLLMERIATELECAVAHASVDVPLRGTHAQLRFLTTVPGNDGGEALRFVEYRMGGLQEVLLGSTDEESLTLADVAESIGATEVAEDGTGIERDEKLFNPLSRRTVSESTRINAVEVEEETSDTNISKHLRFLRFRYYGSSDWVNQWSAEVFPKAVEITLATTRVEAVMQGDGDEGGKSGLSFTRIVQLPMAESKSEEYEE